MRERRAGRRRSSRGSGSPLRLPSEILGRVTAGAAAATGLPQGTPVLVGGADYPLALLGSGVCRPGLASEVAGTSSILTLVTETPVLDPEISNVGTAEGNWGAFVLLEAGGDSARWARRAFHDDNLSYGDILAQAEAAAAGADSLFFLPFLAVVGGVGFWVQPHLRSMEKATGTAPDALVGAGGGAKADLWLRIKSSIYGKPIRIPAEAECGLVGCAILASVATGADSDVAAAATRIVRHDREIRPEPRWQEHYALMQPVFDRIYDSSQAFYDDLDRLDAAAD